MDVASRRALLAGLMLCAGCGSAAPAVHVVDIRAFRYEPAALTVERGDSVVWVNHDVVPHTATGPSGAWDTGAIQRDGRAAWVAAQAGSHTYVCAYHPNMTATLVVR
jgi:plastocyanin